MEVASIDKFVPISEESVVLSSKNDAIVDDKSHSETIVKNLDDISPSEMKQIIEGAEVIVEDISTEIISEQSDTVMKVDEGVDKADDVEVTTTTSTNDSDSIIETVVDSIVEVGSSVIDSNVVQFTASDSTVIELGDAETSINDASVTSVTYPTTSSSDKQSVSMKKFDDDEDYDDNERIPEPDSSR